MALHGTLSSHASKHADVNSPTHKKDKEFYSSEKHYVKVALPTSPVSRPCFYDPQWAQLPWVDTELPEDADLGAILNSKRESFPQLKGKRGTYAKADGSTGIRWVALKAVEPIERDTISFEGFQTDFMRKHFQEHDYRRLLEIGRQQFATLTGRIIIGSNAHFDTDNDHFDFYSSKFDPATGKHLDTKGQRVTAGAAINYRKNLLGLDVPADFDSQLNRQKERSGTDDDSTGGWNAVFGALLDSAIEDWAKERGLADDYEKALERGKRASNEKIKIESTAMRSAELAVELNRISARVEFLEEALGQEKDRNKKLEVQLQKLGAQPQKNQNRLRDPERKLGQEQNAYGDR